MTGNGLKDLNSVAKKVEAKTLLFDPCIDSDIQKNPTINFQMWAPFNIPWTLVGEEKQVYYINRNIVFLKEKNEKYHGLGKYLQEKYLRYYKP